MLNNVLEGNLPDKNSETSFKHNQTETTTCEFENNLKENTSGHDFNVSLLGASYGDELSKSKSEGTETIKPKRGRLLMKNGHYNIHFKNISGKNNIYITDIYTAFVELPWVLVALIYTFIFILSWIGFAGMWFLISYLRNDFDQKNLADANYQRCVQNGIDFSAMILFSLETQTTIGYGFRYATTACPEGMILLMLQTCFGTAIHVFLTGFIFAKLTRPKKRTASILFSEKCVVCKRDDKMVILFRIADTIQSHMIACNISAMLIKKRVTKEGEVLNLEQYNVQFGLEDGKNQNLFLAWPITICHVIDDSSPFYKLSKESLKKTHFELIILLEGTSQLTSQTIQARHSYTPSEILWGHRFKRMIFYQKTKGTYHLNCSTFNDVLPIENFTACSVYCQQNNDLLREENVESSDTDTECDHADYDTKIYNMA